MLNYIILILFAAFSLVLVLFIIRILIRGISIFAEPPINLPAFIAAKICAFASCLFIPAGILWPGLKWHSVPEWVNIIALFTLLSGIAIAVMAMKKLGDDLIFGLPEGSINSLKTDGIFRFSRNPLYLGFILIIISSCLITPNPVNLTAAVTAIAFHHLIILREEAFLLSRLGYEYGDYMNATGRYLLYI